MKIPIWKQFTTVCLHIVIRFQLWLSYEDTNLKAIHNTNSVIYCFDIAVIILWRYQFESNSQLVDEHTKCFTCCDYPMKIPIWKQFTTTTIPQYNEFWLWLSYEDTNLKAIHNAPCACNYSLLAVIILWRYQFESNSQQVYAIEAPVTGCDYPMKIPIWKQFTTYNVYPWGWW